MHQFIAYVDEAGDEGFGKLSVGSIGGQSRWLLLGAVIVSRENDLKLPLLRNRILERFPNRKTNDLHFLNLNHDQKVVTCQHIAEFQLGAVVACSHKVTIPGSPWENVFSQPGYLYNYLVRWLLERVSSACARKDQGGKLKIVFSRRRGTDYAIMKEYLRRMKDGREAVRPVRSINWSVVDIDSIVVENHSKWAGLQIADCVTSAFFRAVEPNQYGNYEPAYAKLLERNLIRRGGNALDYGLIPVPHIEKCGMDASQLEFFRSFSRNEGQAPGS